MIGNLVTIIISIMSIAGTAIGIQCLNDAEKTGTNKNFLIFLLVANILAFLGACIRIYLGR